MNFVRAELPHDIEHGCALYAATVALEKNFCDVHRALWEHLDAKGQVDFNFYDRYLRRLGWKYVEVKKVTMLFEATLPAGRLIAYTDVFRSHEWHGHYCAVIEGDLHDVTDTRDAHLWGFWMDRKW